ncbi:MAG TPA: SDR family oxidoreductase [Solirubrobacterales bacterium]|nr:SDR family oxidoreductase [Solirubrobacterales bacterium]
MRSALLTGASTGIGRATALRLDAEGWRVFAGVRSEADAEALREAGSDRLVPLSLDVTDPAQIVGATERIVAEVGKPGLHGLVNNAGIPSGGAVELLEVGDLRAVLEVNVVGQVAVTQALLPQIRAARGRVVFVGSINGRLAPPFLSAYAASKHAIEAIGDSLRLEMRPFGVEVAIVEPGAVRTPIWGKARQVGEESVAAMSEQQRGLYRAETEALTAAALVNAERGVAPEKVAKGIAHALSARRPRTRYLIGADARAQALLRRLVPDRLRDSLVERLIRINAKAASR